MPQPPVFDPDLIRRYDTTGPRYTSYPTALQFHEGFSAADRDAAITRSQTGDAPPLSLYVHIPFCATVCYYCACTKVITRNRARAAPYLDALIREIELLGARLDPARPVQQLHWGGGTPTFLSASELRRLMQALADHFRLLDDDLGEYAIEIDPRQADAGTIGMLRELGFNRLSVGVQDFDPEVQRAVNRIQSPDETFDLLAAARHSGFRSINVDLIYGLPHQDVGRFLTTLDAVLEAEPERLALFNYAHLPQQFKVQRQIDARSLPNPATRLRILERSIDHLSRAGYVYVGMDHFARPGDDLLLAQQAGTLTRNFQGYSTHGDCDLFGLGMSSISRIADCYAQNHKTLEAYQQALAADRLPLARGLRLGAEDRLRRDVITQLICHFRLDYAAVEQRHGIDFQRHFRSELVRLADLAADDLLTIDDRGLTVRPRGRLLVRNLCMVFDAYRREQAGAPHYSRVI